MDEENNEEDENDYYDNININGILLLKEVISEFFDEEKFLSIMDIGVGNSATCLIYSMINPNISKVVGIDTENPIEFPWNEIQNWKKLDEKKTIEYIKGNILMELIKID